jgi:transcription elongation GreA/GreB family factor
LGIAIKWKKIGDVVKMRLTGTRKEVKILDIK